jgi:hypothetical protein
MALPAAHLLRLPREVRDKILSDLALYHQVSFDWKWKVRGVYRIGFKVTIPHAPQLGILLACSRLHDEYIEHIRSEDQYMDIIWEGSCQNRGVLQNLINHTKYIGAFKYADTVRLKLLLYSAAHWNTTATFINVLQAAAPRVLCVLITKRIMGNGDFHTSEVPKQMAMAVTHGESPFSSAPDMLGEFRLSRTSRIDRVGTEYNIDYFNPRVRTASRSLSRDCHPLDHCIMQYDIFTYTRGDGQPRDLELDAMEALWPQQRFRVEDVKPEWELSDDEMRIIEEHSGRTFRWESKNRDKLLGLHLMFHLEQRKVVADGVILNKNEGFPRWFD